MMAGTPQKLEEHPGVVPVLYSPDLNKRASEVSELLEIGCRHMTELFQTETPALHAMFLDETDWRNAPREAERPYPFGFPYFTRASETPTLVFPEELSKFLQPRTSLTLPLTVWHELAHAFLLDRPTVRSPGWLQEFITQTAAVVVAERENLPIFEHIEPPDYSLGFSLTNEVFWDSLEAQMERQNLRLYLGSVMVRVLGTDFLECLIRSLHEETEVVDADRAEELLVASLGPGGREWLEVRPEFKWGL